MKDAHEPIIEFEKYERVQEEMKRRSNIEIVNGRAIRKETHYSTKCEKHDWPIIEMDWREVMKKVIKDVLFGV